MNKDIQAGQPISARWLNDVKKAAFAPINAVGIAANVSLNTRNLQNGSRLLLDSTLFTLGIPPHRVISIGGASAFTDDKIEATARALGGHQGLGLFAVPNLEVATNASLVAAYAIPYNTPLLFNHSDDDGGDGEIPVGTFCGPGTAVGENYTGSILVKDKAGFIRLTESIGTWDSKPLSWFMRLEVMPTLFGRIQAQIDKWEPDGANVVDEGVMNVEYLDPDGDITNAFNPADNTQLWQIPVRNLSQKDDIRAQTRTTASYVHNIGYVCNLGGGVSIYVGTCDNGITPQSSGSITTADGKTIDVFNPHDVTFLTDDRVKAIEMVDGQSVPWIEPYDFNDCADLEPPSYPVEY